MFPSLSRFSKLQVVTQNQVSEFGLGSPAGTQACIPSESRKNRQMASAQKTIVVVVAVGLLCVVLASYVLSDFLFTKFTPALICNFHHHGGKLNNNTRADLQEELARWRARAVTLEKMLTESKEGSKAWIEKGTLHKCSSAAEGSAPLENSRMILQELAKVCFEHQENNATIAALKCGVISCWNNKIGSVTDACLGLFDKHPSNNFNLKRFRNQLPRDGIHNASVFHRVRLNGHSSVNASMFDAVLDFECDLWPGAAFHSIFDCLAKSLPLLVVQAQHLNDRVEKNVSVAVVIPHYLKRYIDIIVQAIQRHVSWRMIFFTKGKLERNSAGVNIIDSTRRLVLDRGFQSWYIYRGRYHGSEGAWKYHPQSLLATRLFISMIRETYHTATQVCSKIVVIVRPRRYRRGNRAFIDNDNLTAALKAQFGNDTVLSYYGRESFIQTMGVFGQACVVIGYHGAGAINLYFAPAKALMIEITTFRAVAGNGTLISESWDSWRSNQRMVKGLDYVWEVKLVGLHHVPPSHDSAGKANRIGIKRNSPDQALKFSDILLTREHIYDVVLRVHRFLRCRGDHGIVYRPTKAQTPPSSTSSSAHHTTRRKKRSREIPVVSRFNSLDT